MRDRVTCRAAGDGVVGGECATVGTGDIEDTANPGCGNFIRCIEGLNQGSFTCPTDTHFNPAIGACDLPANRVPLCTLTTSATHNHYVKLAPVAKPVQVSSFRERLMTKLHLNH